MSFFWSFAFGNMPVREMCVDVIFFRVSFRSFRQQSKGLCVWNKLPNFVFLPIFFHSRFAAFRFSAIHSHFPVVLRVEYIFFSLRDSLFDYFSLWQYLCSFLLFFHQTTLCFILSSLATNIAFLSTEKAPRANLFLLFKICTCSMSRSMLCNNSYFRLNTIWNLIIKWMAQFWIFP